MIVYRKLDEIESKLPNAVVTIGNFDGVHLGHREIFRRVRKTAEDLGGASVVISFIPHPLKLLPSRKKLQLITTYAEKESLIAGSGIDYLVIIPFTVEFASITASEFVRKVLVGQVGMKKLIIGYDYAFGRNREGNVGLLRQLGADLGFDVEVLAPIGDGETVYSSTRIREMIHHGEVGGVVSLLGRHFSLDGKVVHGHHRGKGLGFPTANLETGNELIPKSGVYAVKADVEGTVYDGACNIGSNPTFGDEYTSIEVFLFDFQGDLYGHDLRLFFVERIRGERRFPSVEALQEAIRSDVAKCREMLRKTLIMNYHEPSE
ncbi:MAG TPA: bifunctional riboflavin kinase/FAD synthetase [Geobacteraceae bacterium]|nr:bifunctional riboflavin kinase/FAD synthetase [Geobacteraceae bacterium]